GVGGRGQARPHPLRDGGRGRGGRARGVPHGGQQDRHHHEVRDADEDAMKPAKWRELSEDEVTQRVRELSEEIFNLRFHLTMGVAKNPARIGIARRDLARAYTIIRERGGEPSAVAAVAAPSATAVADEPAPKTAKKAKPARAKRAKAAKASKAAAKPKAKKKAKG